MGGAAVTTGNRLGAFVDRRTGRISYREAESAVETTQGNGHRSSPKGTATQLHFPPWTCRVWQHIIRSSNLTLLKPWFLGQYPKRWENFTGTGNSVLYEAMTLG